MKIPLLWWCLCWIYSDKSQLEMLVLCRQMRCCGITINAGVNTTNLFVISCMFFSSSGVWPESGLIELDQPTYYLMRRQKKLLVQHTWRAMLRESTFREAPVGQMMSKLGHNTIRQRIDVFSFLTTRAEKREGLSEVNIRGTTASLFCFGRWLGWGNNICGSIEGYVLVGNIMYYPTNIKDL